MLDHETPLRVGLNLTPLRSRHSPEGTQEMVTADATWTAKKSSAQVGKACRCQRGCPTLEPSINSNQQSTLSPRPLTRDVIRGRPLLPIETSASTVELPHFVPSALGISYPILHLAATRDSDLGFNSSRPMNHTLR